MPNETEPGDPRSPPGGSDGTPPDQRDWIDTLYAEGATAEPPEALDAAIRAAARQGAQDTLADKPADSTAKRRPWYRSMRHLTGLATAASVVLAALIIYFPDPESAAPPTSALPLDPSSGTASGVAEDEQAETPRRRAAFTSEAPRKETASALESPPQDQPAESKLEKAGGANRQADRPTAPAAAAEIRADTAPPIRALEPDLDTAGRIEEVVVAASPRESVARESVAGLNAAALSETDLSDAAAPIAEFIAACGNLPGAEEGQIWERDADGWYLIVRSSTGVAYWRCQGEAWREMASPVVSDQQQPDSDND